VHDFAALAVVAVVAAAEPGTKQWVYHVSMVMSMTSSQESPQLAVCTQGGSKCSSLLSGASSDVTQTAKERVTQAVSDLRLQLSAELKHEGVFVNRVIGRGGFGTVYQGA
jgi:hypothetical protein